MAKDTVRLSLDGEIPLSEFARAVSEFHSLVDGLSEEIAGEHEIQWEIEQLNVGSATVVARGESHQIELVERVIAAVDIVGESLEKQQPIPYSEKVALAARGLTSVINGEIKQVILGTPDRQHTLRERIRVESAEEEEVVTGETILYGELLRVGGATPRGMIRLLEGETLYFDIKREIVRELGSRLYTFVGLHGTVQWRVSDLSIKSFRATSITTYEDKPVSDAVANLREVMGEYYEGLDDVEGYIAELRDE